MSTDSTQPEKATGAAPLSSDLTKFQLRCLAVIGAADRAPKGVAVLDALDDYYDEAQHHGRLYPNLDELVAKGLVEKGARDERTNEYWLTDRGRRVLRAETDWFVEHARAAGLDEEPEIVTDGGIPQHLTPTSTIDGDGTIYRCTRCGCEGESVVSHLDGCPAHDGEERVREIATDGGVVQTDHVERARDLLAAARDRLDGLGGAEIVAIDERLAAADEELAAAQEGSQ